METGENPVRSRHCEDNSCAVKSGLFQFFEESGNPAMDGRRQQEAVLDSFFVLYFFICCAGGLPDKREIFYPVFSWKNLKNVERRMDSMPGNVRFDDLAIQMYPSALLHRFGVNGKISGSVGAIGEMENVLTVLHSPKGCGFHYRFSARRRHEPLYHIETTGLEEYDVIFGGGKKLMDTVQKAYERYRPDLILIVSSPVSDILNEDTLDMARELRETYRIPVIAVKSELFSHRDKTYYRKRLKALASQKITGNQKLEMELLGCGFTEVLYALVEQVMEPCQVRAHSINIETVGWGSEGIRSLGEIRACLSEGGIEVNTLFPSCRVEEIQKAPAAALNVAKRVRWARRMKERFGTEYLHLSGGRYEGLEGICHFYQDVADMLGLGEKMAEIVEKKKSEALSATEKKREALGKLRCTMVSRNLSGTPFALKRYLCDYGFTVDRVCLIVTEDARCTSDITEELLEKLLIRVEDACRLYGKGIQIAVNPSEQELEKLLEGADLLIGSNDFTLEGRGVPVLPEKLEEMSYSFESYVRSVNRIYEACVNRFEKKNLLLNKMNVTRESFPLPDTEGNRMARKLWTQMWLNRKEGENHACSGRM